ncbi:hypothetical protein Q1695_012282 [Nippostrongylus brasiliensis]|nr:hypothetical protein Q1695_012282 [Nippostrongylus brasiliensis]
MFNQLCYIEVKVTDFVHTSWCEEERRNEGIAPTNPVIPMTRSEDELGEKIDRCFADSLLKISGGIAIGIVASVAFFKSRSWPIWFGSGIGIGTGWSNCRHDLAQPYLLHGKKVAVGQDTQEKPTYAIVQEK